MSVDLGTAKRERLDDVGARMLLTAYAVYAIVDAVRLGWLWAYPFSPLARVALPLAAAAAIGLGLRPVVGARRRAAIGLAGTAIGLQFLLAFGTFTPWVGLLLAVALTVRLRPRFPRLSRSARRHVLFVHVAASVSWLGLAMAMTVLSVVGLTATDELSRSSYRLMHVFDLTLVIPLVVTSIVTGIVLSVMTHWGLIRHWWVLAKFAMSMTILGTAAFYENFLVRRLAEDPFGHPGDQVPLVICMIGFTVLLVAATVLSIHRPQGRTPWGRSPDARPVNAPVVV